MKDCNLITNEWVQQQGNIREYKGDIIRNGCVGVLFTLFVEPYNSGCMDTKSWRSTDVRTEPMRTPFDDEIYITGTLAGTLLLKGHHSQQ